MDKLHKGNPFQHFKLNNASIEEFNQEREIYKIKELDYYDYLNKGCFDIADTDDGENLKETKDCMKKLLFTENTIN